MLTPAPTSAPIWDETLAAYDAAEKADAEYCGAVWNPAFDIWVKGGPNIPDDIETHMQSLMDVSKAAETVLMHIPSETPQQTLLKLLIALGNGRECFGYLPTILAEAEHFTGRTAQ